MAQGAWLGTLGSQGPATGWRKKEKRIRKFGWSSCTKSLRSLAHLRMIIGENQSFFMQLFFKPQQPYKRCVSEAFKDFPVPALELVVKLLSIDPADRGSAASALKSQFFYTKPLACDPSSLPNYPPSKELDAKIRDEEARQREAGGWGQRFNERKGVKESQAVPAPDANAELATSLQKRQVQPHAKSRSEKFNPHPEEVASGIPIDQPRPSPAAESKIDPQQLPKRASHSGPLSQRSDWVKDGKRPEDAPKISIVPENQSFMSISASRRSLLSDDRKDRSGPSHPDVPKLIGRLSGSFKETSESLIQQDQKYQIQNASGFQSKEDERSAKKDPVLLGYGSKGNKIHYSGPLIVPSGNMDQMLKDHDRHIQEAFRRSRIDKAKARKIQVEGNQIIAGSLFISGR